MWVLLELVILRQTFITFTEKKGFECSEETPRYEIAIRYTQYRAACKNSIRSYQCGSCEQLPAIAAAR